MHRNGLCSSRCAHVGPRVTLLLFAACLLCGPMATAQSAAPAASLAWDRVQSLPLNSHLEIAADKNGGPCVLQVVTLESLVCTHGRSTRTLPRAEIRSIKLSRRGRSTAVGLGLGAAIGVAAGVGIGAAINSSDRGNLLHVSTGKAASVGAGLGVIVGAGTGALVGHMTDLAAGPTIYKR